MPRPLLIAACCIPYAFLCLWGDVTHDTLLLYVLLLPAVYFLMRQVRRICPALLLGHAVSFLSSFLCLQLFRTERWSWYFKPFSALDFMAAQSLTALAVHLLLCRKRRP